MAVAVFKTESSKIDGEVLFEQNGQDVKVKAFFSKLPAGEHGFHIHKAGDLRGEGCKGACDHFHRGSPSRHGGPPGSSGLRHTGDLGNIALGPGDKAFEKTYVLKNLSVESLFGRSVIIHADPDDLGKGDHEDSKTTGHSGARIGCAIIGRISCPLQQGGGQLFNDNPRGFPRVKGIGYGTAKRARKSIRKIRKMPTSYKRQIATTMYHRAKYHKYQTRNMRNAMKIYRKYLKTLKKK